MGLSDRECGAELGLPGGIQPIRLSAKHDERRGTYEHHEPQSIRASGCPVEVVFVKSCIGDAKAQKFKYRPSLDVTLKRSGSALANAPVLCSTLYYELGYVRVGGAGHVFALVFAGELVADGLLVTVQWSAVEAPFERRRARHHGSRGGPRKPAQGSEGGR